MRFLAMALVLTLAVIAALARPAPASAAIHELVASFCSGQQVQDPPGQLNTRGNSFLRALQASGIYEFEPGADQAGKTGFDFTTGSFGPLPAPAAGTTPVSVFVDDTRPNAKLGDFLFWAFFVDPELGISVYLQIFELDHPAFANCPGFDDGP